MICDVLLVHLDLAPVRHCFSLVKLGVLLVEDFSSVAEGGCCAEISWVRWHAEE
jgi:hypothetical protein